MALQETASFLGLALISDRALQSEDPYEESEVTQLVRSALLNSGLGQRDTAAPLSDVIEPGMSVLLKPNWVLDRNLGGVDMDSMVTHPVFLKATLREVLLAKPGCVTIGDAPIQLCRWDHLVTPEFRNVLMKEASAAGVPLEIVDFRRTIATSGSVSDGFAEGVRDESRYVRFDLGADSLLEPISTPRNRFRITNYDPRKLAQTHRSGVHQYLLCKEAFEADFILSLPKLKTHCKAGLTGALKNLVGLNGNKDYLPHHRLGGSAQGGDCYPGRSLRKRLAEFCLDQANMRIGEKGYDFWYRLAFKHWRNRGRIEDRGVEGAWYGNDTVWRMVLDLNRILQYGRIDGTMSDQRQRRVYSLTDAIVCGEGNGPLAPDPIPIRAVTFSSSSANADALHAALLRFDPRKIRLISHAFENYRWPIAESVGWPSISMDGERLMLGEVSRRFGTAVKPPSGWAGQIEWVTGDANCDSTGLYPLERRKA